MIETWGTGCEIESSTFGENLEELYATNNYSSISITLLPGYGLPDELDGIHFNLVAYLSETGTRFSPSSNAVTAYKTVMLLRSIQRRRCKQMTTPYMGARWIYRLLQYSAWVQNSNGMNPQDD